jgi:hypothetical protein
MRAQTHRALLQRGEEMLASLDRARRQEQEHDQAHEHAQAADEGQGGRETSPVPSPMREHSFRASVRPRSLLARLRQRDDARRERERELEVERERERERERYRERERERERENIRELREREFVMQRRMLGSFAALHDQVELRRRALGDGSRDVDLMSLTSGGGGSGGGTRPFGGERTSWQDFGRSPDESELRLETEASRQAERQQERDRELEREWGAGSVRQREEDSDSNASGSGSVWTRYLDRLHNDPRYESGMCPLPIHHYLLLNFEFQCSTLAS